MVITRLLGELMVSQILRYYLVGFTFNDRAVIHIGIYIYIVVVGDLSRG